MESEVAAAGDSILLQLGVGGIFAIMVIREVLGFLRDRKGGATSEEGAKTRELVHQVKSKLDELHKWHDVRDDEQVPVWYVRKSLEREIGKLCEAVGKLEQAATKQAAAIEKLVEVGDE
jgi:hypothetical protein